MKLLPIADIEANTQYTAESILDVLLAHFAYSMDDVKSYDELTQQEQNIISREMFDAIFEK